jgi:hypothetical protein
LPTDFSLELFKLFNICFCGVLWLDSTIEKQMLLWEFANANANDTLFINKIAGILEKYGMHTPMELLINPPSKHMGKQ